MSEIVVCALYRFTRLPQYASLKQPLHDVMLEGGVFGTLLLAAEGINGTIAGSRSGVDAVLRWLKSVPGLGELEVKESFADTLPFRRAKVKLKREIVTMGKPDIDPNRAVGTYVDPEDWNALIDDPTVTLIDTRNEYEVKVGSFEGALNPNTETFREFPRYVSEQLDPAKQRKIAMFCTGGIRCEKSTALLKEMGFDEVYHLKGGILKYLEKVPKQNSRWHGECFVFDDRVTVDHALKPGSFDQCHACRLPISEQDKQSANYQKGISCPYCYDHKTDADRARYAERHRQMEGEE